MNVPAVWCSLLGSYLVGSIPTAYLVVKWLKRIDVRTMGSGNVGATNVARTAGLWAGLAVFVVDAAKGLAAVSLIAPGLLSSMSSIQRITCGFAAVVGHVFPVFLGFRGGKGVATTIGVLLGAMPMVAAVFLLVWGICFLLWRYVSVSSMAAAATIPLAQRLWHHDRSEVLLGVALALLIIAKHRSNIQWLLTGQEHRARRSR